MNSVVDGDYIREITKRADAAIAAGDITIEEKKAILREAILVGRPAEAVPAVTPVTVPVAIGDFREMRLPSGVPLTYDMIRDFAWSYVNLRAREKELKIIYGVKTVGGLQRLKSFMCITAYRACDVIKPDAAVRSKVIKRCSDITDRVKKATATDPGDIELPDDMTGTLTDVELRIMERSKRANKKVYLLEGRLGWVDALIRSGDYVGYRTVEELKGEKTKLSAMANTTTDYYRELEPFLQYIETNEIDIRYFGPMELRNYGDTFLAADFAFKQYRYAKKREYYEKNPKEYRRDLRLNMARHNRDRKTAEELMPARPQPVSRTTVVGNLNTISTFFKWFTEGGNFPPDADGVVKNPLAGVTIIEEEAEIIPYKLMMTDRKELLIETDEIIPIYRSVLSAPLKEQYKRGIFILLRIIRESGARPANVVWLRWMDFPKTKPRMIKWRYVKGKKVGGKGAPDTTYISDHLAEDIDAYIRDYEPDPKEYVAGSGIFTRHELELDEESGYLTLDKGILATHILRLGKFTDGVPVSSKKFRKSLASLVWACLESNTLVEELTGDLASTIKKHYKDTDWQYVDLPESIHGKFTPAEIARRVFDKEYPTTGIPDKYMKSLV